jgi:hypothetical protein
MPEREKAFEDLKDWFTTVRSLTHFDQRKTYIMDTNSTINSLAPSKVQNLSSK